MQSFDDVTRLRPASAGRSEALVPASWGQGRAVFGGVPAGVALGAMTALVDADRPVRSLAVTFAGPVSPGAMWVEARVLRAGRAMTLAEAIQHLRAEAGRKYDPEVVAGIVETPTELLRA